MNRASDWQVRLEAFVRARERMPFEWGRTDCGLTAADAVEAMTGERLCPDLRGYVGARAAARLVKRKGGLRALACTALGEAVSPSYARPGDVVTVRAGRREALAICSGRTAFAPGVNGGLVHLPMSEATAAWRVG